jgi:hypothetical protein
VRPTRIIIHIVLALVAVSVLACGQDNPKPAEQAPAATVQPVIAEPAKVIEPTPEPAAAPEPAQPTELEPAKPGAQAPSAQAPAAPTPGTTAVCTEVCDRTEKLNCGPLEVCMAACAAANDGSVCPKEMSTFMMCALKHPAEHWECSDQGVAAIRDGYCDREQEAFMSCVMKTPG